MLIRILVMPIGIFYGLLTVSSIVTLCLYGLVRNGKIHKKLACR